ncbi:hypothetical protein AAG906_035384 [Vitis piasezkii]
MKLISGAQSVSYAFVAVCGVYVIGLFHIAAAQTTQANATTNHLKNQTNGTQVGNHAPELPSLRLIIPGSNVIVPTTMQYLSMGINALSGDLPKELGQLIDLRSFAFGTNNFSGSLPSELWNLVKLEQLIKPA